MSPDSALTAAGWPWPLCSLSRSICAGHVLDTTFRVVIYRLLSAHSRFAAQLQDRVGGKVSCPAVKLLLGWSGSSSRSWVILVTGFLPAALLQLQGLYSPSPPCFHLWRSPHAHLTSSSMREKCLPIEENKRTEKLSLCRMHRTPKCSISLDPSYTKLRIMSSRFAHCVLYTSNELFLDYGQLCDFPEAISLKSLFLCSSCLTLRLNFPSGFLCAVSQRAEQECCL